MRGVLIIGARTRTPTGDLVHVVVAECHRPAWSGVRLRGVRLELLAVSPQLMTRCGAAPTGPGVVLGVAINRLGHQRVKFV